MAKTKTIKDQIVKEVKKEVIRAINEESRDGEIRTPGKIINGFKVGYTRQYMDKFPKITFTPSETMDIKWNGMPYHLEVDTECTVPNVIKEAYDETRKERRLANRPLAGIKFDPGAGALTGAAE